MNTNLNIDMEKINKYTVKELLEEDVFVFSVVLCDNEIDRDNERFSIESLYKLKELFVGKTGIFDHNHKSENQVSRIFDTEIIIDETKTTRAKEKYHYVKAKAYMINSAENKELIDEINYGIKKEVSVGCSVAKILCSSCGKNIKEGLCKHSFNDDKSHKILDGVKDAYEWSFVAVPAQLLAGVSKSFLGDGVAENVDRTKILKKIENSEPIAANEVKCIYKYIKHLEKIAESGNRYVDKIKENILKISFLNNSSMSGESIKSIMDKLSLDELLEFEKSFHINKPMTQLGNSFNDDGLGKKNDDYKMGNNKL